MSTIHELGNALRARRTEMGLSQARVAALSGLSRQTVNQIETGAVPDLGLNKAERLASVLGLMLRVTGPAPKAVVDDWRTLGYSLAAAKSAQGVSLARSLGLGPATEQQLAATPDGALDKATATGSLPATKKKGR